MSIEYMPAYVSYNHFPSINVTIDNQGHCNWSSLKPYKQSIVEISNFFRDFIPLDDMNELLNIVISENPGFWGEIRQVADFSGISAKMLLAINILYDTSTAPFGCTVFAVKGKLGPIHCHCLDWELGKKMLEGNTVILNFLSVEGTQMFSSIGWLGFLGVYYGIAKQRFTITLNAVWSNDEKRDVTPLGLFLRNIFYRCCDFISACQKLEEEEISSNAIFLITGTGSDEIAVIERTPIRSAVRRCESDIVFATNHFVKLRTGITSPGYRMTGEEPYGEGSFDRYTTIERMFRNNPPETISDCITYLTKSPFINKLTILRCVVDGITGELRISPVMQRDFWLSFPTPQTIDGLITKTVLANLYKTAVRGYEEEFSYSDILNYGILTARYLKTRGLGKGDTVCLMCRRDFPGLAAAIGIMMCGAIYVPISIEYPEKRKLYIAQDSSSKFILYDSAAGGLEHCAVPSIKLEELLCIGQDCKLDQAPPIVGEHDSQDPAYILYTSGSTGRPKGVVVSHEAAINTFRWMIDEFDLTAGECIPQKTPWSFTDSLWEMFLPLIIGGVVGFISEEHVRNPVALYHRLNEIEAVITQFVPPAMTAFLDELERAEQELVFPSLRWILNGGEELPRVVVDRWFSLVQNVGYANSYGMTESAIYSTCYLMQVPPVWGMRRIPIGTPILNTQICIFSQEGRPLSGDNIGEIGVTGKSLMTEYWNQPELTEQSFFTHPESGCKYYRTGDFGACREDGLFVYLGRNDDQVKLLGMRVELKEIQRVMLDHHLIKQAYLMTKGEGDKKYIKAFFTTYDEKLDGHEVNAYLRTKLPAYMIPAFCIPLDSFPLTEHNKIDFDKLRELEDHLDNENDRYFSSLLEEEISLIWEKNLGHKNFGPTDPFFFVGGNSLMIIRIYGQLSESYRELISIPDLLSHPTIRGLASFINKRRHADENIAPRQKRKHYGNLSKRRNRSNHVER